jgi:hypothetical protein
MINQEHTIGSCLISHSRILQGLLPIDHMNHGQHNMAMGENSM